MKTRVDYGDLALDCLRLAAQTTDTARRETLVALARAWMEAALTVDDHAASTGDTIDWSRELRGKLN